MMERAANCRSKAHDWKAAALLFKSHTVPRQPKKAAESFEKCGSWSEAAGMWTLVPGGHDKALECCIKGKDWALGVSLIQSQGHRLSPQGQGDLPKRSEDFLKRAFRDCLKHDRGEQMQEYAGMLPYASALALFQRYNSTVFQLTECLPFRPPQTNPQQRQKNLNLHCSNSTLSAALFLLSRHGLVQEELALYLHDGSAVSLDSAAALCLTMGDMGKALELYMKSGKL